MNFFHLVLRANHRHSQPSKWKPSLAFVPDNLPTHHVPSTPARSYSNLLFVSLSLILFVFSLFCTIGIKLCLLRIPHVLAASSKNTHYYSAARVLLGMESTSILGRVVTQ